MRAFFEIIENLTSTIQRIIGMIMFGIMALGLMFSIGISYFGSRAVDTLGERAERVSEQAIRAELEARRAEDLAKDGWGYRPLDKDTRSSSDRRESAKNGWGN